MGDRQYYASGFIYYVSCMGVIFTPVHVVMSVIRDYVPWTDAVFSPTAALTVAFAVVAYKVRRYYDRQRWLHQVRQEQKVHQK